jgi:hypothetical protein
MVIERTKDEVIFRLPATIDVDELQNLADWLEFKEIVKKSKATQKDVDSLLKEVKKGRWDRTKRELGMK